MEIGFENRLDAEYDGLEQVYSDIAEVAFAILGIKANYEIDVSLVGDEDIQTINREYRKIDRVTDVISFAFEDDKSDISRIKGDEVPRLLGEIFVCVPQALRQAKEIGNSPARELTFLFVGMSLLFVSSLVEKCFDSAKKLREKKAEEGYFRLHFMN